jgi:hypothetical protein
MAVSMAERVWRISTAAMALPSTKAGMIVVAKDCRQSSANETYPEGGSQPSFTLINRISMMPSQKFGVDRPASPIPLAM